MTNYLMVGPLLSVGITEFVATLLAMVCLAAMLLSTTKWFSAKILGVAVVITVTCIGTLFWPVLLINGFWTLGVSTFYSLVVGIAVPLLAVVYCIKKLDNFYKKN